MIETSDISKALNTITNHSDEKSKWARYAGMGLTGLAVYAQVKVLYDRYRSWADHTVEVRADEVIYTEVLEWVLDALPPQRRRSTRAVVGGWADDDDDGPVSISSVKSPERSRRRLVRLVHDGTREAKVKIDGHVVKVTVRQKAEVSSYDNNSRGGYRRQRVEPSVVFTARDAAGHKAVVDLLQELTDATFGRIITRPEVEVYQLSKWGDWTRLTAVGRSLDSVVLADGLAERIAADLAEFLSLEEAYVNAGLPWHRGYLFHGPPGCGKSSLPKALAQQLGLRIYSVSLPSVSDGEILSTALSQIPHRSVLLLEDIDVASASRVRDDENSKGVAMSDLLNALDGIATPHGLVAVMTTNRVEDLDDALVRPGRADMTVEFGRPDREQIIDLIHAVTDIEPVLLDTELAADVPDTISHADVVGWMKPYLGDPWKALAAVKDGLEKVNTF